MNPCAWCLKEAGEQPNPNDSHGICDRHTAEMLREIEERLEGK